MLESSDIAEVDVVVVPEVEVVVEVVEVDAVVSLVSPSSPVQPAIAIPAARERARIGGGEVGAFA